MRQDRWYGLQVPRALAGALVVCASLCVAGCQAESPAPRAEEAKPSAIPQQTEAASLDPQTVAGRWVRADHPYYLGLDVSTEDGVLEAAYYNPNPINVSIAEVREAEGELEVFVELRDVNYPGSTYTLKYDASEDVLQGVYFQAVERQSFDVTFVRFRE